MLHHATLDHDFVLRVIFHFHKAQGSRNSRSAKLNTANPRCSRSNYAQADDAHSTTCSYRLQLITTCHQHCCLLNRAHLATLDENSNHGPANARQRAVASVTRAREHTSTTTASATQIMQPCTRRNLGPVGIVDDTRVRHLVTMLLPCERSP